MGVVLVFHDIAERRQAERERLLSETAAARAEAEFERGHLQSLFLQAPVAINILRGPELIYEFIQPLTRARLDADVKGTAIGAVFNHEEEQAIVRIFHEVLQTGDLTIARGAIPRARPPASSIWWPTSPAR